MNTLLRLVADLDESRPLTAPPMWLRIYGSVVRPTRIVEELRFDRLVGYCAPRSCAALAVVAGGWASPMEDHAGLARARARQPRGAGGSTGSAGGSTWSAGVAERSATGSMDSSTSTWSAGVAERSATGSMDSSTSTWSAGSAPPSTNGVANGSMARSTNGSTTAPTRTVDSTDGPGRPRQRIRTTVVVDRDGAVAGRLRWESGHVVDEPPGSGRMLDCLRRGLRLATDPPAVGTGVLFAAMWLAAVSEAAGQSGPALTWPEAAALHPVAQLIGDDLTGLPGSLVDAADALAVACPWSEVRRLISEGGWEDSDVPMAAAAWMDDGMLSRWLLDGRRPLSQEVDSAAALLSPDVAGRIRRTLRQLGLGGSSVGTCHRQR